MALDTYTGLQNSIESWLNRSDLSEGQIKDFISLAEGRFRKDDRIRNPRLTTLDVGSEEVSLPTDFHSMIELAHDGPTYYGGLENANLGELTALNERDGGAAGPPEAFLIVGDNRLRFAPAPDETYTLEFHYWQKVPALSDTAVSNWLLENHPDIYLFGALAETAPFLHEDERVAMWEQLLERRIAQLDKQIEKQKWSGPIKRAAPDFTP